MGESSISFFFPLAAANSFFLSDLLCQNDLTELVTDLRLEYRDASVHADADLLGLLRSALEVKV